MNTTRFFLFATACLLTTMWQGCTDWRAEIRAESDRRKAEIAQITDQAELAKIAEGRSELSKMKLEDGGERELFDVEETAIAKLTDQVELAKIATGSYSLLGGIAAIEHLKDQATLVSIAQEEGHSTSDIWSNKGYRLAAITRITDQAAVESAYVDDEHGYGYLTLGVLDAAWRVRYALDDPTIRMRLPDAVFVIKYDNNDQTYSVIDRGLAAGSETVYNEIVSFTIESEHDRNYAVDKGGSLAGLSSNFPVEEWQQGSKALATDTWYSVFPKEINTRIIQYPVPLIPADVDVSKMLDQLLSQPVFTREDFLNLTQSKSIALRIAALAKIDDQIVLAKISLEDKESSVRDAAKKRLAQVILNGH